MDKNLKYLIQDVRNARAKAAMLDPAAVSDALEISENLKEDLLQLAEEIAEYENQAEAIGMYIKDAQERKSRCESTAKTLRNVILQAMVMNDMDSLPGDAATLSVTRRSPSITVVDEVLVPARFFKPQPATVDLQAIKKEYEDTGELFAGCDLDNGSISLMIRRK